MTKCYQCKQADAVGMLVDLEGRDDLEVRLCQPCADEAMADIDEEYKKVVIFAVGIFNNRQIVDNLDRLRQENHYYD